MRYRLPVLVLLSICTVTLTGWAQRTSPNPDAPSTSDEKAIEQLEADLLKAEQNTEPAVIDRIFSDDWVNLTPTGLGPNKPAALGNFQEHSGQEPPYFVHTENMRIYVFGDSAVAAYVKVYKAKENGNVAYQDMTDVYTKVGGVWKMRLKRTSPHAEQ